MVFTSIIFNDNFKFDIAISDGRSRAGVYCAANACIEQVIQHGEVDIFQAVKTVRRHRPQLIENMVKIILIKRILHDIATQFVGSMPANSCMDKAIN